MSTLEEQCQLVVDNELDMYNQLYNFIRNSTARFILNAKKRDTYYVKGPKYLILAKILNRLASDLIDDDHYLIPTVFDTEIKELEDKWWKGKPDVDELDKVLGTYSIITDTEDGGCLHSPVDTVDSRRYNKLTSLKIKQQDKVHKERLRLFHEYLKKFNNISW